MGWSNNSGVMQRTAFSSFDTEKAAESGLVWACVEREIPARSIYRSVSNERWQRIKDGYAGDFVAAREIVETGIAPETSDSATTVSKCHVRSRTDRCSGDNPTEARRLDG
jgi:hypothetical protein